MFEPIELLIPLITSPPKDTGRRGQTTERGARPDNLSKQRVVANGCDESSSRPLKKKKGER